MFKAPKLFVTLSVAVVLLLSLFACSNPIIQTPATTAPHPPRLTPDAAIMADGYVLPMKTWAPANKTANKAAGKAANQATNQAAAVVLALHGFNDYSNAFAASAHIFADNLIVTYAIDQRGFGTTEQNGIWAGTPTLQTDLVTTLTLLCEKHAGLPVFVLGESMGGAVILSAMQQLQPTCIRGVILSAPAVWGWQAMPWWQTVPLRLLAHTLPELTVTGEGLEIHPSDNIEMLRALGRDPLVIKETRIDAIYGLTDLMDAAMQNSAALTMPALILYGEHDEIIPADAFCAMLNKLPDRAASQWRLLLYPNGYHMLSRDLQGERVIRDMVVWIHDQGAVLPSGQEVVPGASRLAAVSVCD